MEAFRRGAAFESSLRSFFFSQSITIAPLSWILQCSQGLSALVPKCLLHSFEEMQRRAQSPRSRGGKQTTQTGHSHQPASPNNRSQNKFRVSRIQPWDLPTQNRKTQELSDRSCKVGPESDGVISTLKTRDRTVEHLHCEDETNE